MAHLSRPENVSGWVGKFVSFSPGGVSDDDIRFQDIWLRTFQECDVDGKFRLKMIRKADQAAKSWPRTGDPLFGTESVAVRQIARHVSSPYAFFLGSQISNVLQLQLQSLKAALLRI